MTTHNINSLPFQYTADSQRTPIVNTTNDMLILQKTNLSGAQTNIMWLLPNGTIQLQQYVNRISTINHPVTTWKTQLYENSQTWESLEIVTKDTEESTVISGTYMSVLTTLTMVVTEYIKLQQITSANWLTHAHCKPNCLTRHLTNNMKTINRNVPYSTSIYSYDVIINNVI